MIFVLSTGGYGDYGIDGACRALCEISPDELLADYLQSHPRQRDPDKFSGDALLSWLEDEGVVERVTDRHERNLPIHLVMYETAF